MSFSILLVTSLFRFLALTWEVKRSGNFYRLSVAFTYCELNVKYMCALWQLVWQLSHKEILNLQNKRLRFVSPFRCRLPYLNFRFWRRNIYDIENKYDEDCSEHLSYALNINVAYKLALTAGVATISLWNFKTPKQTPLIFKFQRDFAI